MKKYIPKLLVTVLSLMSLPHAFASVEHFQVCGAKPAIRSLYFREIQGPASNGVFTLPEITNALSQGGQIALDHYENGTFSSPYPITAEISCLCIGLVLRDRSENDSPSDQPLSLHYRMTGGSPGAECLPRSHPRRVTTIRI